MADKKYEKYTFTEPEYLVIADLIVGDPVLARFKDATDLLDYKPSGSNRSNRKIVLESLKKADLDSGKYDGVADADLPVVLGTTILIPKSKIEDLSEQVLVALTENQANKTVDSSKFTSFVNSTHLELLANNNYTALHKNSSAGNYIDFFPQITVFVWCRALDQVINISPFIHKCDTSSDFNGSSFSITLPSIIGKFEGGEWVIDKYTISDFTDKSNFVAMSSLLKSYNLKENDFYFHRILKQGDLVFIQYETLELEKDRRTTDNRSYIVDYSKLPNRVYDLIGSIDSNTISMSPSGADISINIQGRDLSKLLIDDGTYFFIEEMLGTLMEDTPKNAKLRGRIYGAVPELNAIGFRSVKDQLSIILRLYFSTGYYPDYIFKNWENKSTFLEPQSDKVALYKEDLETRSTNTKLLIENSREQYGLTLKTGESNEVDSIFNELIRRIESGSFAQINDIDATITPDSLDYFDGKLYIKDKLQSKSLSDGDDINLGFTSSAISSAYSVVDKKKQGAPSLISGDKERDGIWKIFDIEVDPSIANIRIYNNKLNEANGSILASIQAMVEEPFMEVFMDTYKDRFKLIARRQPFNQKYYNDLVVQTIIDNGSRQAGVINAEEVISSNLGFYDDEIYTWFYLTPNAVGLPETRLVTYIGAVILHEYVDIWGSKPYQKETNYAPFVSKKDIDAKINTDLKQAVLDLKYMIEINAYLPFTRKGTITINGDRTIKKGQAIRFTQTGEIFHVDGISHTYMKGQGVDRTTTLQVSRGMIEKYMTPKDVDGIEGVSYFNIVNTDFSESDIKEYDESGNPENSDLQFKITRDWKVNPKIFEFFFKGKQFADLALSVNYNDNSSNLNSIVG